MGRLKKFNREEVLERALPQFWAQGFSGTVVQDLEKATGVNKSGLYSEFKDKEDLFLASLRHYYQEVEKKLSSSALPLGWENIESMLKSVAQPPAGRRRGCFGVNSMRELELLPDKAREIVSDFRSRMRRQIKKNIVASGCKSSPDALADMVLTFFSGICIEQNLNQSKASSLRKIEDFVRLIRSA